MAKSAEAFRTISEVADWLDVQTHVLRFWESKFTQVKPVKRAGGRRYYRPNDMALLAGIRVLLHDDGVTIRGVQKILREKGIKHVVGLNDRPLAGMEDEAPPTDEAPEVTASEPESGKIIPMQPTGNVSNLFDNSDDQPAEQKEKPEEPEPLSLFAHRAEPVTETPAAEAEAPAEEPVPSFSHAAPESPVQQDEPTEPELPAAAPDPDPTDAATPEPETAAVATIEMPVASPVSGPALAATVAAAARLAPESLITRADRLAPAARRLQELHARMTGKTG